MNEGQSETFIWREAGSAGLMSAPVGVRIRQALAYRDTRTLVAMFLLAQMLDSATTALALGTGRFVEANPWLGASVATHPLAVYGFKLLSAIVVVTAVLVIRLRWRLRRTVLIVLTMASIAAPIANLARIAGLY